MELEFDLPGDVEEAPSSGRVGAEPRALEAKKVAKASEKKATKIEAGRRAYEAELRRKWEERGWPWPTQEAPHE